jgi:uncharacterized protein YjbJ (UPF0337 family)
MPASQVGLWRPRSLHFAGNLRVSSANCDAIRGLEHHFQREQQMARKRLGRIEPRTANKGEQMNKLEIKGDWNIAKGRLKQKFAQLTDNDLRYSRGQEDELLGRLQKLTGETEQELQRVIKESFEG